MRPFTWWDDFTGARLAPGWQVSAAPAEAGTISRPHGPGTGGIWVMGLYGGTSPQSPGAARTIRLRYGGAHPADVIDARHFSPAKDLRFECRFLLNAADLLKVTVGLTGWHDPDQVLAALYRPGEGWRLQARNLPDGTTTDEITGWSHTPGQWVELEIRTIWTERRAVLTINGNDAAEVCGPMVTNQPLCAELQLWNRPDAQGVYSAPTLYVDTIGCEQAR